MLQKTTLKFLRDLKKNNTKQWFDLHRPAYEEAKNDFELFVQALITGQGKKDKHIGSLKPKECVFRINRDIRFSKDKSPYKPNFGASISRGGKKSSFAGYYFHLEPGQSFAGGGLWMPSAPELKKIRQEIDYGFAQFSRLISSKKFKAMFGDLSMDDAFRLSKVPQGFEKDHPGVEYLKLKSFVAFRPLTDKELLSGDLLRISLEAFEILRPVLEFLNAALES